MKKHETIARRLIGLLLVLCSWPIQAALIETGDVTGGPADDWRIGDTGTGSVAIDDGTSQDAVYVQIGDKAGAIGTLTVTGAGSTLHSTNVMTVGNHAGAEGTINVTDGGLVESSELTVIGDEGKGTVNLSGAGSRMIAGNNPAATRNALVGNLGDSEGTVTISSGASFEASRFAYAGYQDNARGTYNVLGGSLITARHLILGYQDDAQGSLNVDNGVVDIGAGEAGSTTTYDLYMGFGDQAEGTANIVNGSTVTIHDDLYMGYAPASGASNNNKATLNVSGAGTTVSVADRVRLGYGWNGPTDTLLSVGRGATINALGAGEFITASDALDTATMQFIIGDDGTGLIASGLINAGHFGFGAGSALFDLKVTSPTPLFLGDMFTLVDYGTWDGALFSNVPDDGLFYAGGYGFLIDYNFDLGGGDLALTATVASASAPAPGSALLILLGIATYGSVVRSRGRESAA